MFKDNKLEKEYNKVMRKLAELFYRDGTYSREVLEFMNEDILYNMDIIKDNLSSDVEKLKEALDDAPESIHKVCLKNTHDDRKVIIRNFNGDDRMVITTTEYMNRDDMSGNYLESYLNVGYDLVEAVYKKEI